MQKTIQRVPVLDMFLVNGDLNARVGNENTNRESERARNMGTHGCGIMKYNGKSLCELCEENKLVIGGTIFHHKEIHKETLTSPDGVTTSQEDHILVNKKWRRLLPYVRTRTLQKLERYHLSITGKVFSKTIQERLTMALQASGKGNPAVTTYIL